MFSARAATPKIQKDAVTAVLSTMPAGIETTQNARGGEALPALMSHDLRTPLGPIALAVSAIADDAAAPEGVRELAMFAAAQCSRLARMIDAALWAVRGAGRGGGPQVDLAEVAAGAVRAAEALRLQCSLDVTSTIVSLDPRSGREAITALIEAVAGEDEPASVSVGPDDGSTALVRIGGPSLASCVDAAARPGPSDWRAAYVLGAAAVAEAHGGSVAVSNDAINLRLPLA